MGANREQTRVSEREQEWAGLMRLAIAGDEAAYQKLLSALVPVLRALTRRGLMRCGQSADDAEDIVQDILIAVHVKRHTWMPDAAFSPWLFAIARNKLVDSLRRRGRRVFVPVEDFEHVIEDRAQGVRDDERFEHQTSDVLPHLANLPKGQRDAVQAIVIEGHAPNEAAKRLGMSEGALRVALHRGIKALAKIVRENTNEDR